MRHSPQELPEKAVNGGVKVQSLGRWGERLVADCLERKGWTVRELNYRCRAGEVDVIAADRQYLVFVEVKLRRSDRFAAAREAVTPEKQRKLRTAAESYLAAHPTQLQPRFDVAEVYAPQGMETKSPHISYLVNAF